MIRLSICIATLNRAEALRQTLDSVVDELPESVEIVIVDGASTDPTRDVVEDFQARCPRVRYLQLSEKGGVDRDYARAVDLAVGEFCWLMTDDDLFVPGAVTRVLATLSDDVDLAICNAEIRDQELREVLYERKLPLDEDRVFGNGDWDELFRETADLLSFIGSVVIRRSVWKEREKESYFGTEFVHVGVIFQKPLAQNVVVLADPLVQIRYGNALWVERAFKIWMFQWPELLWSFPSISDTAKKSVLDREPWNSLKLLLLFKARGHYSRTEYRRFLRDAPFRVGRRGLAWTIAAVPDRLYNFVADLAARLLRPRDRMLHLELRASRFSWKRASESESVSVSVSV